MIGLVIFAHGSSVASANAAVDVVAADAARAGGLLVEAGFLEPVHPTLDDAVAKLLSRGASRIVVVPYFLTLGLHLQRDLPRLVKRAADAHPGVEIRVTSPLDGHPALVGIVLDRARAGMQGW